MRSFLLCLGVVAACSDVSSSSPGSGDASVDDTAPPFYVSPSGSDVLGDGSKARPLKTIQAALTKLTPDRRRVYVCEGRYEGGLYLRAEHAALHLMGGFDCNWQPNGSRAVITSTFETPITIDKVEAPITLESIEASTPDATNPTNKNARDAAVLRTQGDVILRNVRLVAGRGADGDAGREIPPPTGGRCFTSCSPDGTRGGRNPCAFEESYGGSAPGGSGRPGSTPNGGTEGLACDQGGSGKDGADGADGAHGAPGQAGGTVTRGNLWCTDGTATDCNSVPIFVPNAGGSGALGKVAQGGGAGGGANGGGGGAGGCGAGAGGGGAGGGSSVVIVALGARVTIRSSSLQTGGGGNGGGGMTGKPKWPGGEPAANVPAGGCPGGRGGRGGAGGNGGGGAGGSSIGIVFSGPAPDVDAATTMQLGDAGKGGATPSGSPGADGVRAPTLQAPLGT